MKLKPNTHGGKRPNSGRKKGRKSDTFLHLRIPAEKKARFESAAGGNLSAWVINACEKALTDT